MTANTALPIQVQLFKTPTQAPKYSLQVKLKGGDQLQAADPKATRALVALMDMQAVLGGAASHWGGPSAFAEILSALHALMFHQALRKKAQWYDLYHFVNDAGHCENGIYALRSSYGVPSFSVQDLRGFRSVQSHLTGHGESHLNPQGVFLSNGPLGSAFPQSQGLCAADRLLNNQRLTITVMSDGASMEGEAREAFAAIPGLAAKGKMNPYVLIISDNNTKLSGRIDQDSFDMSGTFQGLAQLGWDVINLPEGHNLQACLQVIEESFERAQKNPQRPVVIHAKTVKGYGVQKTEKSSSGGHGFPLKEPAELRAFLEEVYRGEKIPAEFLTWLGELEQEGARRAQAAKKAAPSVPSEKIQIGVASAMIKAKERGLPVVSVTSDLPGSTGVADFHKKYPESSFDVGVAEANMVSMAAGLSKQGFIPFVDTFAQFGITKGALPLIMGSLSQAPVIGVFSHTGFQDAADGASHQALSWTAMTAAIPLTDIYALSCSAEAEALVNQAIEHFANERRQGQVPRSKLFFLGRENFPRHYGEGIRYELGRAQVLLDNSSQYRHCVTVAVGGSLVPDALRAAKLLQETQIGTIIVNVSCLNRPDMETLGECVKKSQGNLVTVEDHQVVGGMGSLVVHALAVEGLELQVRSLGVCDEFGQSAYTSQELYKKHGLDAESIARAARGLCEG